MALTPNLVRIAVAADGSTSSWSDNTVYGSTNPNRNQVAVYLTAYKVDENLVESSLLVTPFDPAVATTFITANDIDGHYKYYFVIVNNYNGSTTYNQYNVVYSASPAGFYQYNNPTPSSGSPVTDTTHWTPVPDPTKLIANIGTPTDPLNLTWQIVEKVLDYNTAKCFTKLTINKCKDSCDDCGCSEGCDDKMFKLVNRIFDLLTAMRLDEAQQLFTAGERAARMAEKYCGDCGCSTR